MLAVGFGSCLGQKHLTLSQNESEKSFPLGRSPVQALFAQDLYGFREARRKGREWP